jgi:hypothetical protein
MSLLKSYIACLFGIHRIGHSFILCGLSSSVFSFLIAQLTKLVNKTLILVVALCAISIIMVYLNVEQSFTSLVIVYALPILFGLLEGVWGTVLNSKHFFATHCSNSLKNLINIGFCLAIIGTAFMDKQLVAFANNRFSISVCFFITYGYSGLLCVYLKTYIVIGLSIVSVFSMIALEIMMRKDAKQDVHTNINFINT